MTSDLICLLGGTSYTWGEQLLYYPEQAPMDACSSSTKIGSGQLQEEVLEWLNYPHASARPGYRVSSRGLPNQLASLPVLYYLASSVVAKSVFRKAFEELSESC